LISLASALLLRIPGVLPIFVNPCCYNVSLWWPLALFHQFANFFNGCFDFICRIGFYILKRLL
jgi:hypothetical protein